MRSSDKDIARRMPCSTPTKTTTAAVVTASVNSPGLSRRMEPRARRSMRNPLRRIDLAYAPTLSGDEAKHSQERDGRSGPELSTEPEAARVADQDHLRRIVALVTSESSHRRDHLWKETALPHSRIFSIFKSAFRGSFVGIPTELLQLATFVAVMPAQDQWLG
jgi:hypothetical protein